MGYNPVLSQLSYVVLFVPNFIMTAQTSSCFWGATILAQHPLGAKVGRILDAALAAVHPASLLRSQVSLTNGELRVANITYPLTSYRKLTLLAVGKASLSMTQAWLSVPDMLKPERGIVVVKHKAEIAIPGADAIEVIEGGHPIPDARSLQAGQRIREVLSDLRANDLLVCLISGGGSALAILPPPPLTLYDVQMLTEALLRCGAEITEINVVRRHLDLLKGGGVARLASPARLLTLILSDVLGDSLEAIASGPTAPDSTTKQDALFVLEKYGLHTRISPSVLAALLETPKPGDEVFTRVQNVVIGRNRDALQAALCQAQREGFHAVLLNDDLRGEARERGRALSRVLRDVHEQGKPVPRPACLLAGGETTVALGEAKGRGGRNQELALAAVPELAGLPDVLFITLATDGEDGPTDAAGAVVNGETARRAVTLGLDPDVMLQQHDSYTFFTALGDAIRIGPTGTNVNDLVLLFAF